MIGFCLAVATQKKMAMCLALKNVADVTLLVQE
jgi:hypothetical protein